MTEYGPEPGSRPWYPDDPYAGYGDRSWGHEAQYADAQYAAPYAPPDPYAQAQAAQPHYGQQPAYGQYDAYPADPNSPYPNGPYAADAYAQHDPYAPYAAPQQPGGYEQFPPPQQQQAYAAQDFGGAAYVPAQALGEPYDWGAGPGTGAPVHPGPEPPYDPEHLGGPGGGYATGAGGAAGYAPQYVEPQPPPVHGQSAAFAEPVPAADPGAHGYGGPAYPPGADPETGWDPGPDQGEHAFFADRDEEDWDDEDGDGRGRRPKRPGKRRNGCACLGVSLALAGVVGTAGYFGYGFYQDHFGPPPDYSGNGSGQTQVTVSGGDSVSDMGTALQRAGVVKSPRAFVEAAHDDSRGDRIQPGTYSLHKHMSGRAAVALMLDPSSQNALIVPEGARASAIYRLIDKKLGARPGTTAKAAHHADLGLPSWAKGKPEGLLFPSRYSVGKKADPADVLREMVERGKSEHAKVDLVAKAKKAGRTPEEVLTIASLIQAEAQEDRDFGKVSRVIGNRLDKRMRLGFDSTINYAKGRSTLTTSVRDTHYPSPYNTYLHHGLPPGPIDNPGHQAIEAALHPTPGDWLYFVTVKPGDTRFAATKAEHDRNVRAFNREQHKKKEHGG